MTRKFRKRIIIEKTYGSKFGIIYSRNQYGAGFHETNKIF